MQRTAMDVATQQILSNLGGESRGTEDGLANFGNKVKEYWNTVKTDPQVLTSRRGALNGVDSFFGSCF